MYYVYILQSKTDRTFYIGHTNNLENRLKRHNSGRAKYSKRHRPWLLIYSEEYNNKKDAYRREMEIKSYKGGIQFKKLISLHE